KLQYVTGYFDGVILGHRFSYWGFFRERQTEPAACHGRIQASFTEHWDKYLAKVTVGQVSDGLDEFYGDYRNRSIRVSDAIWLVLNEASGKSRAEMDVMIENWRKNAKP